MTIDLPPDVAAALTRLASCTDATPEAAAVGVLRERLLPNTPRDEWERGLLAVAADGGGQVRAEALSSEGLYE